MAGERLCTYPIGIIENRQRAAEQKLGESAAIENFRMEGKAIGFYLSKVYDLSHLQEVPPFTLATGYFKVEKIELKKEDRIEIYCRPDIIPEHFDKVVFGKKVSEIMTKNPLFVSSSVSILDGLKSIVNTHYRRLPVIEDKKLEGIITAIDLLNYIKENKFEFEALDEPISRIMKKDVYTINVDADISEAIIMMKLKNVGGLLVVKDKKLEGIITERNILEEIV
jgi:CBS domain-containing protein